MSSQNEVLHLKSSLPMSTSSSPDIQQPAVLLHREESTMASSWSEYLCLWEVPTGFRLSTCKPGWLGSIYELVPEEDLYDDQGDLRVPEIWEGKRIVGLGDGEYLETEEMQPKAESQIFDGGSMDVASAFCEVAGWRKHAEFGRAWQTLEVEMKKRASD